MSAGPACPASGLPQSVAASVPFGTPSRWDAYLLFAIYRGCIVSPLQPQLPSVELSATKTESDENAAGTRHTPVIEPILVSSLEVVK